MMFVLGTVMLFCGVLSSPFLSLRAVGNVQLVSSALLTAFGLVITLGSVAW